MEPCDADFNSPNEHKYCLACQMQAEKARSAFNKNDVGSCASVLLFSNAAAETVARGPGPVSVSFCFNVLLICNTPPTNNNVTWCSLGGKLMLHLSCVFFSCTFCPPVKYAALVCEYILCILAILRCVLQPDGCLVLSDLRGLLPKRVMSKSSRPHWGAAFLSACMEDCRGVALISAGQLGV